MKISSLVTFGFFKIYNWTTIFMYSKIDKDSDTVKMQLCSDYASAAGARFSFRSFVYSV